MSVTRAEDARIQGSDACAGEYPTIDNRLSAIHPSGLHRARVRFRFAYGPCSPARDSASLRTSEAILAERGDGAVSLCFPSVSIYKDAQEGPPQRQLTHAMPGRSAKQNLLIDPFLTAFSANCHKPRSTESSPPSKSTVVVLFPAESFSLP